MAIDGVIAFVAPGSERGEQTLDLFVVDRLPDDHDQYGGMRGQPNLRILRPQWAPAIGMRIWGGDATVRIVAPDGERVYDRVGYTRLVERGADDPYRPGF